MVHLAVIALLSFTLGIGLVYEFVGAKEPEETPGTPADVTGAGSPAGTPPGTTGATATSGGNPQAGTAHPGRAGEASTAGEATDAAAPPKKLEYGELNWQKKPKKKKIEPVKKRTIYERERDLVKPEGAEGNAVR